MSGENMLKKQLKILDTLELIDKICDSDDNDDEDIYISSCMVQRFNNVNSLPPPTEINHIIKTKQKSIVDAGVDNIECSTNEYDAPNSDSDTDVDDILSNIFQKNAKEAEEHKAPKAKPTKGLSDSENPLEYLSNDIFVRTYRFKKETVQDILQMILHGLTYDTNRGHPVPPIINLLITLKYFATGKK